MRPFLREQGGGLPGDTKMEASYVKEWLWKSDAQNGGQDSEEKIQNISKYIMYNVLITLRTIKMHEGDVVSEWHDKNDKK